jgi:hypothetical protein
MKNLLCKAENKNYFKCVDCPAGISYCIKFTDSYEKMEKCKYLKNYVMTSTTLNQNISIQLKIKCGYEKSIDFILN